MKGLLLKDWYQAKTLLPFQLAAVIVMMGVSVYGWRNGSNFFMLYGCFILGMMPMSLLSYDHSSRWDSYSGTLPVTRTQLVSAKYIVVLVLAGAAAVLTCVVMALAVLLGASVSGTQAAVQVIQVLVVMLWGNTIVLPFLYRFGAEKGRYAYVGMIAVIAAVIGALTAQSENGLIQTQLLGNATLPLYFAVLAVTCGFFALSWRLSIAWCGKAGQ